VIGGSGELGSGGGFLAALDFSGDVLWATSVGGIAIASATSTSDGGYVLAGTVRDEASGTDVHLVKTNAVGRVEWSRSYGSADDGAGVAAFEVEAGFLVVARIESVDTGVTRPLVIKFTEEGSVRWRRAYEFGTTDVVVEAAAQARDGGLVLAGFVRQPDDDVWLARIDGAGFPVWETRVARAGHQRVTATDITPAGAYVVAGSDENDRDEPVPYFAKFVVEERSDRTFVRGDSTRDGVLDVSDAVRVLNWLFLGSAALACLDAGDGDDDGTITVADAVLVLAFLYRGGPAPEAPFPMAGADPTDDAVGCAD